MIKKGIKVKILTGKDKNKDGDVIDIDRKILADLAMNDIETFAAIAKEAKSQLAA